MQERRVQDRRHPRRGASRRVACLRARRPRRARRARCRVEIPRRRPAELDVRPAGELDGLFHFSPVVSAASLEGVERLALIARHGVGLDFIDLDACTERGIAVTITPGGCHAADGVGGGDADVGAVASPARARPSAARRALVGGAVRSARARAYGADARRRRLRPHRPRGRPTAAALGAARAGEPAKRPR